MHNINYKRKYGNKNYTKNIILKIKIIKIKINKKIKISNKKRMFNLHFPYNL